jgi:transcriptional regulator with XRE-family HTH domain
MAYRSINLVTGRQLRAARTLAGMTQRDLATVLAVNDRAVRFWESKHDRRPTSAPNDTRIEQALLARGVILFAEPTPGAARRKARTITRTRARPETGNSATNNARLGGTAIWHDFSQQRSRPGGIIPLRWAASSSCVMLRLSPA